MSTKELLIQSINDLTEEQQQSLLMFLLTMTQQSVPPETLDAIQEVSEMKQNPDAFQGYTDMEALIKDMES